MTQEIRYNVFNNIHKGLRAMLFTVQMNMQQTDYASPEADTIIAELEKVLRYYDEHADHEDRHILANIIQQEPQIAKALEEDHVIDHQLSEKLRDMLYKWKGAATTGEKNEAASATFYALNDFIAFNLYHMNKEETALLPLLWKHFSDAEIMDMEHQIVASINPEVLMDESRWMMRSISNAEIKAWLGGVKAGAPDFVYQSFVQMAAEELPAQRFATLQLA